MKTKIATALSLIGVLGAGSAAAMVNTQILDSGPSGADNTSLLAPNGTTVTTTTTPTTTQPTTTTLAAATTTQPSTTTAATTVVVTVPATAPTASGFLTTYNLDPAGVVTVDVLNGSPIIVAHTPSAGWNVVAAENITAELRSTVTFSDGVTNVDFEVRLVNGALVPTVSSSSVVPSTTTGSTVAGGNTSTTVDDDDHDDDDDDHGGDDDDDDNDHGGSGGGGGDDDHDDD